MGRRRRSLGDDRYTMPLTVTHTVVVPAVFTTSPRAGGPRSRRTMSSICITSTLSSMDDTPRHERFFVSVILEVLGSCEAATIAADLSTRCAACFGDLAVDRGLPSARA